MYLLEIQGRSYALGLWWQVREGGQAPRKIMLSLARSTAQEFEAYKYNYVSLRRHQFGLGHWNGKMPSNPPSLAAALKPSALRSISIFCLESPPEGSETGGVWWLCSIQQGTISADGDRIFESFAAAKQQSRELLSYMRECDQELICMTPEESMIAIAAMLRPEARVESLFPDPGQKKGRIVFAAVLGGLLAVAILLPWYFNWREERQIQRDLQSAQARRESRQAELVADSSQLFPRVWEKEESPAALLNGCLSELQSLPLVSNGWLLASALCSPETLALAWVHQPGASYIILPAQARLAGPTKADTILPRKLPLAQRDTRQLARVPAIAARFYQITQDGGLNLRIFKWQEPQSKEVDGIIVTAPWQHGEWEIDAIPVAVLPKLGVELGKLPGVIIKQVQYQDSSWNIKGVTYAHP